MVLTLDVSRDGARPRVGVIGAGRWGWNLVRTLHALEVLHAVADPRDEVRDRVSVEYPDVLVLATHQDLLSSGVDAVVIATPASTHAVLAIEALRAGKAAFVEKPFALTVEDAERIVHEADAAQLVLMAGHLLLYQPAIVWLSDFLRSGRIGWVASFYQDRLSLGTVRRLENSLWSLGVHDVAAILYLAGQEPVRLAAWGYAPPYALPRRGRSSHPQFLALA
jgi:predicted dehydrogenase